MGICYNVINYNIFNLKGGNKVQKKSLLVILLVLVLMVTACAPKKSIIPAEDWEKKHPDQYATYLNNSEMESTTYGGSEPIDYLEKYPYLKTFYDGYGFSKEYLRARGHVYGLEDVMNTARPKPGASCLACKSADFIELLNKDGIAVNSLKFEDVAKPEMNTISCYDCHTNTPGTVVVTREHLNVGLNSLDKEFKDGELACGQCHVEYYLDPTTKEVILPWKNGQGVDGMIEYYDEIDFADWTHPTTGTKLLKAQHPEFETYQGGKHNGFGLTCADCHMPEIENSKGEEFHSHQWTSPLKTIESSCLSCHGNETADSLTGKVEAIQAAVDVKTQTVAEEILQLINELTKAVQSGTVDDKTLNEARDYHRKAQFKWDFIFVENGEGFHNEDLAHKYLNEASELAKKGLEVLK